MGTLLGLIFGVLAISAKTASVHGTVYASEDTALKFSQCLINKMSESQLFTGDDLNSMAEVQNIMVQALRSTEQTLFTAKVLVIAFVTSLADVVILEDVFRNNYRKDLYTVALEQCSLSSTGYVDREFINEAMKILSVIEKNKMAQTRKSSAFGQVVNPPKVNYGDYSIPQTSGLFIPPAVQPSPVQNPYIPQTYNPGVKTVFEPPETPFLHPLPALSIPALNPSFVSQSSSETSSFGFSNSGLSQSGGLQQGFATASLFPKGVIPSGTLDSSMLPLQNFPLEYNAGSVSHSSSSFSNSAPRDFPQFSGIFSDSPPNNKPQPEKISILNPDKSGIPQPRTAFTGVGTGSMPQLGALSPAPSLIDTSGLSLPGGGLAGDSSAHSSPIIDTFSSSDTNGGSSVMLNIPQTKESSVIVIPPIDIKQFDQNEQPSQNLPFETYQKVYQPSTLENIPQGQGNDVSMTSSATMPQVNEQYTITPFNPAPENIVLNILSNSPSFKEAFNQEISQEDAIKLARSVAEKSLVGYDISVVNEMLTAVSNAVGSLNFRSSENYAFALSDALVSVLKARNLPLSVDGSFIATRFLSNLESTRQFSSETNIFGKQSKDSVPIEPVSYEYEGKQKDFDFQSPPLSPEDMVAEIFSKNLAHELTNSNAFKTFFCNNQKDRVPISFSVIKSSLANYGPKISSLAASIASGALSELSNEELCNGYAKVISEAIAEVFDENTAYNANPSSIVQQMENSLQKQKIEDIEPENQKLGSNNSSSADTGIEPNDSVTVLQPSFSVNFTESKPIESVPSTSFKQPSGDSITESLKDSEYTTPNGITYAKNVPGLASDQVPPNSEQTPFKTPDEETGKDYKNLDPTTYSAESPNDDFFGVGTLTEAITSLFEVHPTKSSVEWVDSDDVINQEALTDYLIHEFESAYQSYISKESEPEGSGDQMEEVPSTAETTTNSESGKSETLSKGIRPFPGARNHFGWRRRRRTTTPRINTVTQPSVQTGDDESFRNDNPAVSDKEVESSVPQTGSDISADKKIDTDSIETSRLKPDELQPSFQSPNSRSPDSSRDMLKPNSETSSDDSSNVDTSLVFARDVSQIAANTIDYVRSRNFDMITLCARLNTLAPIVNIPPLDVCEETAAIDYLLNVLRSVTKELKGV